MIYRDEVLVDDDLLYIHTYNFMCIYTYIYVFYNAISLLYIHICDVILDEVYEVPYCMMFLGGQRVYGKRIHGIRMAPRDAAAAKPKVLLVEENPAIQLKLERWGPQKYSYDYICNMKI